VVMSAVRDKTRRFCSKSIEKDDFLAGIGTAKKASDCFIPFALNPDMVPLSLQPVSRVPRDIPLHVYPQTGTGGAVPAYPRQKRSAERNPADLLFVFFLSVRLVFNPLRVVQPGHHLPNMSVDGDRFPIVQGQKGRCSRQAFFPTPGKAMSSALAFA